MTSNIVTLLTNQVNNQRHLYHLRTIHNLRNFHTSCGKVILKLINNLSRENKENHYSDRGLDMCS